MIITKWDHLKYAFINRYWLCGSSLIRVKYELTVTKETAVRILLWKILPTPSDWRYRQRCGVMHINTYYKLCCRYHTCFVLRNNRNQYIKQSHMFTLFILYIYILYTGWAKSLDLQYCMLKVFLLLRNLIYCSFYFIHKRYTPISHNINTSGRWNEQHHRLYTGLP